jgi:hypothetical protein
MSVLLREAAELLRTGLSIDGQILDIQRCLTAYGSFVMSADKQDNRLCSKSGCNIEIEEQWSIG